MNNSPKVQIFILTHNRPQYVMISLKSVLHQTYPNFEVIVSDNSTNDHTQKLFIGFRDPRVTYTQRNTPLDSNPHFKQCVQEVDAPYFMLFHDDDILEPNFLTQVMEVFKQNHEITAVGTGFRTINTKCDDLGTPFSLDGQTRVIRSSDEFLRPYLLYDSKLASYCSYAYRTDCVDVAMWDINHGRKYSDVSTLLKIMNNGPIAWIEKTLVKSRKHPDQDSQSQDIYGRLSLLRFIYSQSSISRHSPEAMNYRRIAWCDWLKLNWRDALKKHPRRYFKIFRIMLPYLIKNKLKLFKHPSIRP